MARLDLAFLGPPRVQVDGRPAVFPTTKALGLLVYLAVEAGQAHQRASLAERFWPDQPEGVARTNLRQALTRLRRALGDEAAEEAQTFLLVDGQSVQFNRQSDHALDLAAFGELVRASDSHAHRNPIACLACGQRWQQAAALYRGEFLEGFFLKDSAGFEEWVLVQRERLRRAAMKVLDQAARQAERLEAYALARQALARQLELEPWREETHQALMRLLALAGERTAALAQYEACRRALAHELGVAPDAGTTQLYERIRDDQAIEAGPEAQERRQRLQALPAPATALVGREVERAELNDLLAKPDCRLVTILGMGGSGKTRLALSIAQNQAHAFEHGVAFVPLASLPSAQALPAAVAEALGVRPEGGADHQALLMDFLRPRELLLVLDGFEHMLAEGQAGQLAGNVTAAGLVGAILQQARQVVLLVTSRECLGLPAEWLFDLEGLDYPAGDDSEAALAAHGAVRLFIERAQQVNRGFAAAGAELPQIAHICRLAQGLPLAIELAAATVNSRPIEALAAELDRGLLSLAAPRRDAAGRHSSVRATFDYSWQLLSPGEQRLFQRLAVFAGGFEEEAATTVADAPAALLARLVDRSLVRLGANGRFQLHDLLRQFAAEKLRANGEEAHLRQRHLAYFAAWMKAVEPNLMGAQMEATLLRVESTHDDLRAALRWAEASGDAVLGLQLAGSLWYFWYVHGHWREGRSWLETFVALNPAEADAGTQAKGLDGLGVLLWRLGESELAMRKLEEAVAMLRRQEGQPGLAQVLAHVGIVGMVVGNLTQAQEAYAESLALSRTLGDQTGVARALHNLGNLAVMQGNYDQAVLAYEECLALYQAQDERSGTALLTLGLATIAQEQRDLDRAHVLFDQSRELAHTLGDTWNEAQAIFALGDIAFERGDYAAATRHLQGSLAGFERLGDMDGVSRTHIIRGLVLWAQGDMAGAAERLRDGLLGFQSLGSQIGIATALEGFAHLAGDVEQPALAARLLAAAARLRATNQVAVVGFKQDALEGLIAQLRSHLGQAAFDQQWAAGTALSAEAAAAEALALADPELD